SARLCRNVLSRGASQFDDCLLKYPSTGICWARAASGHTVAPPSRATNARLLVSMLDTPSVMAGLVPAIHVCAALPKKDVDAPHEAGHDGFRPRRLIRSPRRRGRVMAAAP